MEKNMIYRNKRVYPIQLTNELGKTIVIQPNELCELPESIGYIYDAMLEKVYLEAPTKITNDFFPIESIPTITEANYIDETVVETMEDTTLLNETKKGRGRPKKV
jgi:hypothetical protein